MAKTFNTRYDNLALGCFLNSYQIHVAFSFVAFFIGILVIIDHRFIHLFKITISLNSHAF